MGREISRRDFLHGAVGGLVANAVLVPGCSPGQAPSYPLASGSTGMAGAPRDPGAYPPARLGARGSHVGAFEVAHQMAFEKRTDWGPAASPDTGEYDLVVVGAGISGLAAAHFYRDQNPGARILLLENHDDFGGHAKRNEFEWNGRTILGYGGSQSLEGPGAYSDVAKTLLEKIGVGTVRLDSAYDKEFFLRNDLAPGVFFDRATYGTDRVVRTALIDSAEWLPVAPSGASIEDSISKMPLSAPARRELLALCSASEDRLPEHSLLSEPEYLRTISYQDFLTRHAGITEPEVLGLLQNVPSGYWGHGIDVVPALDALGFGMPGLGATSLGNFEGLLRRFVSFGTEDYTYHFPDGNASVARLLVRSLIPAVGEGERMEEIVTAAFDYGALDVEEAQVRLRLGSTVVRVQHDGAPSSAERVGITYVRAGNTEHVRAKRVVLACYNTVVPYLCPELPEPQSDALRSLVKIPLVYTSVLLRRWTAFQKLGLAAAHCPGSWHQFAMLDFPVSLGDYRFSAEPEDPIVVHMSRAMTKPGLRPRDQSRAGCYELLGTSFETIEREIRTHLGGMLGAGGFDPATDIEGIAVNRWPHGYAFEPNPLFDPDYAPGEAPHEIGRQRFGRIAIANSDAGASAYVDSAIDQAWRAVGDLSG